ncbi:hypothetical protein SAMN04488595_11236 [Ralstonia sp. 25mfcol4.1]|uniref:hypothetical protein n=1 Tax=Ralstonia sp. 25mfcol4.1 TaxID=1761899 RepID=UPI00040D11BC|nr:hypothetical protein [Ralstonia sp. 25mfcol4.1]SDP57228.1 hypothetical protein SAMN04488595_11236 [Ralstonia sp. 25mfcol4.1]
MTSNSPLSPRHLQNLRVALIGACYYTSPAEFARLTSSFAEILMQDGGFSRQCLVSMRAPVEAAVEPVGATSWVPCKGRFFDISAYASALDIAGDHDLYVVLNDTLFTKHAWRPLAQRLSALMPSLAAVDEPAAAGEVHPSTDLLMVDARNPTRRHLSTFCFLLNRAGFETMWDLSRQLPSDAESGTVRAWLDQLCSAHTPLKHLLHVHLFGPVSPWSWKGRLNPSTPEDLILRKAVTVAFEYLLSETLLQRQGLVMPVNYGFKYRLGAKANVLLSRIVRK